MTNSSALFNILLVIITLILLYPYLQHEWQSSNTRRKKYRPWNLKPRTPHDCPLCCQQVTLPPIIQRDVLPYSATKSRRGRKKTISSAGFACLNPTCSYYHIYDEERHALVSYGKQSNTQRWKCQSCGDVFTAHKGTPLYYLKTAIRDVKLALNLLAEGNDQAVIVRVFGFSEATVQDWLHRMGLHSTRWHDLLFRDLRPTVLQLDELYTRVRSDASARWVWVAIEPVSKIFFSLHIGNRTNDDAFAFLHDIKQRLAPDWVPAFTTDGLRGYFYSITAHFGSWSRPPRARTDHWLPSPDLLHGVLVKQQHSPKKPFSHTRMLWGKRHDLYAKLRAVGLKDTIQTAFVERVNLTLRQSIAPLSRRTWAYAQTDYGLLSSCAWTRLYYNFVRPHQSLELPTPGLKKRYRKRTPAMAAGITDRIWSIEDLLRYPVPQVA